MVDVNGMPQTIFIGEIASIDGKKIELPKEKAVNRALAEEKKPAVPQVKALAHPHSLKPTNTEKGVTLPHGANQVVSTPDGSIIIVGQESIVKYDKDLNLIKKIDLKADNR
jgi:hypothetical protein